MLTHINTCAYACKHILAYKHKHTHHLHPHANTHTYAYMHEHTNTYTQHINAQTHRAFHYGVMARPKAPGRGNGKNQRENCTRQCLAPGENAMECFPQILVISYRSAQTRLIEGWPGSFTRRRPQASLPAPEPKRLPSSQCYQSPDQGWPGQSTEATARLLVDHPPDPPHSAGL